MKPCPFCGKTPDADEPNTFVLATGGKWGAVQCCCIGPEVRTSYLPLEKWRDEAIAAWDDRVVVREPLAAVYAAAENMVRVKGRHHSEQAYAALVEAVEVVRRG